jgi:hypothetical protein
MHNCKANEQVLSVLFRGLSKGIFDAVYIALFAEKSDNIRV